MRWQLKSAIFRAFDRLPFADPLYYLVQRYVTRTVPRPTDRLQRDLREILRHMDAFREQGLDVRQGTLVTVGAGWDLLENLAFCTQGVTRQIAIDVSPLARAELVNRMAKYLGLTPIEGDLREGLKRQFNIGYRAPSDAHTMDIDDASVQMIVSHLTFQHIPVVALKSILSEMRRVLAPDGLLSLKINYSDHFQHTDPSIGVFNFLRFTESEWQRHNSSRHHLNRLRHCDIVALALAGGFKQVKEEVWRRSDWSEQLSRHPLAEPFDRYKPEDLAVEEGLLVFRRAG